MPKPGPGTTYEYSEEFKATAVRLSELQGVAVKDVAECEPMLTANPGQRATLRAARA